MYASLSTRVYYSEVSPGKWIKRVKIMTKEMFNAPKFGLSKNYPGRANKKTK